VGRHAASDVVVAVGAAGSLAYLGYRAALLSPSWLIAFGLVLAAMATARAIQLRTLTFDLDARTWTRRTGLRPLAHTQAGTFKDLEALVLAIEVRSIGEGGDYPVWVIRLALRDASVPHAIAEFSNEHKAYEQFESLVKTLELDAIDRTGDRERRLPWHLFARPIVSRTVRVGIQNQGDHMLSWVPIVERGRRSVVSKDSRELP
jgi:hypothetical protein